MTKFKKHEDPDVRWLYEEHKKLKQESVRVIQENNRQEKEITRLKDNVKYLS